MTSRERRAMRQRRATRELGRDVRALERTVRDIGLDLDDQDSRLGLAEGAIEQLGMDVSNLEAEIDD